MLLPVDFLFFHMDTYSCEKGVPYHDAIHFPTLRRCLGLRNPRHTECFPAQRIVNTFLVFSYLDRRNDHDVLVVQNLHYGVSWAMSIPEPSLSRRPNAVIRRSPSSSMASHTEIRTASGLKYIFMKQTQIAIGPKPSYCMISLTGIKSRICR